jgi:hypothetical protein
VHQDFTGAQHDQAFGGAVVQVHRRGGVQPQPRAVGQLAAALLPRGRGQVGRQALPVGLAQAALLPGQQAAGAGRQQQGQTQGMAPAVAGRGQGLARDRGRQAVQLLLPLCIQGGDALPGLGMQRVGLQPALPLLPGVLRRVGRCHRPGSAASARRHGPRQAGWWP